ncbi:HIT family protein [Gleimia hominis]|uniref:HIT family protein n=1 Tax=Gleimia hominis TaxID=595468 RepID=A0ABU3IAL4_9ACTO|nr:HIT family protein [Gleimia hominis]MDT3767429.1 HIT family protein [Gleimia hominis]
MTVFEEIIAGNLPAKFAYADDLCVVFATHEPINPGHMLVVPRKAYSAWTQMPADELAHLAKVAQLIGQAQTKTFECDRAGLTIAGFEVPHVHMHVIPLTCEADLDLSKARKISERKLEASTSALRAQLKEMGHEDNVPIVIDSPELD